MKLRQQAKRIAVIRAKRVDELSTPIRELPWRTVKAHLDRQLAKLDAALSGKAP